MRVDDDLRKRAPQIRSRFGVARMRRTGRFSQVIICCVGPNAREPGLTGPHHQGSNVMRTKSKMSRDDVLEILRNHKQVLSERFGVTEISLFGSFARDEATEDSDIDVVVKFEGSPTLMTYSRAQIYLEDMFERNVDLAQKQDLREEIRPYVERDLMEVRGGNARSRLAIFRQRHDRVLRKSDRVYA